MINCPSCNSSDCRRSRRRGFTDFSYGLIGLIPWRCNNCEARFRSRPVPFSHAKFAHCAICGNFDLKRISPEHVPGPMGPIGRILGLPSLRCEPCRHKFFSIRPLKEGASEESSESEQKVA
jgi:hypothetical protein